MQKYPLLFGLFGLSCYSMTAPLCADSKKPLSSYIVTLTPTDSQTKTLPQKEKKETVIEEECLENPASFRLSVKHLEANGIGYNQGYTSVDGFFAFTSIANWHPFFDIRAHFFNDGRPAANVGFGVRYQPNEAQAIIGVNGFFDFRRTGNSTFEQAGVGIEVLGTKWAFRSNGYFPIINKNNLYDVSFSDFSGHYAVFSVKRELAFKGFDLSLGRTLVHKQFYSLAATLGGYMFFADFDKQASGGLFQLKATISQYFSIQGQTSYDNLFKGIIQGQIGLNIPFGKQIKARKKNLSCSASQALAQRITEPVNRFEIIVTDHYNTQTTALDVRTKKDLYMVFVDNTNSGGNGTAENPYSTLSAAENNSGPGDMIYVYSGNEYTTGQDEGITLKESQWLQGSVKSFPVITSYGASRIPAQTSTWTTIGTTSGDTVTLADHNIIVGMNIIAKDSGIAGSDITHFSASYNNILGGDSYDFYLEGIEGIVSLNNNKGYSREGVFVRTANDLTLTIRNNTFSNRGKENLTLKFKGDSNSTVSIGFNKFQYSKFGSSIAVQNSSKVLLSMEDNTFINARSSADHILKIKTENSAKTTAILRYNEFKGPTISGLNLVTTNNANSFFYLLDNTGTDTNSSNDGYPFDFLVESFATTSLFLEDNTANVNGYLLTNADSTSNFIVQSPTLSLSGVESINSGSFTTVGDITYISFTPSSIP